MCECLYRVSKSFFTETVKYWTVITFTSIQFSLATVGNAVVTACLVCNSCCVLTSYFCKRLAVKYSCIPLQLECNFDNAVCGKSCLRPPHTRTHTHTHILSAISLLIYSTALKLPIFKYLLYIFTGIFNYKIINL
jgi:hypothetical protein